jgi:ubiquinone/menaquinone biosynthesis C-methylase UbiE
MFEESLAEALRFAPSGFALLPTYLLDKVYRILDWNEAFSLAFDRTMDGRTGHSVLEWTYFLDNYEAVVEHSKRFADPDNLPEIDVEPIAYTSMRYGRLDGIKRAYRIPGDSGTPVAWLVTIEPRFDSAATELAYKQDLIGLMSLDLMWSEYALSYDNVLLNTTMYTELIQTMTGTRDGGPLSPLPDEAWILDLGAGTGNVSQALAAQKRRYHVIALENNRTMLECLKAKCCVEAAASIEQPGVFAVRQNIASLFGIPDNSIDCAIMNNVLYSIADHEGALREVLRVLKPGGELRISGPHKRSDVDVLFRDIKEDLQAKSLFAELRPAYDRVYAINRMRLASMLQRWTTSELADDLLKLGFSQVLHASETIYNGQSMLLSVRK